MAQQPAAPPPGEAAPPAAASPDAPAASAAADEGGTNQFGTFGGVFTPVVLTILGVIMFMRTGYVVGYAGLVSALVILLIAKLITTLTTLSLSAIATNLDVRVGGVYFMISRVLGPDFGGSIGITLFVAQAVSIAFYTIGFTEAVFDVLGNLVSAGLVESMVAAHVPEIASSVIVTGLFALTFKGADVALKAQYVVLAVLLLSVVAFLIGGVLNFDASLLEANMVGDYEPVAADREKTLTFMVMFAIFFPAATGITAGANMSGDLKDAGKSIPTGTLIAIFFTATVYAVQIFLVAGSTSREALKADPFGALQEMSIFGPLIVLGVFAATLSSALGSFLGAPRILQAMGQDKLMKSFEYFGKGSGPANEPRRATVLSLIIAVAVIWAGDLNAVAEIISMFFLIAYGMINLSAFVESRSANPSFRPTFRWFHWGTGLAGAVACLVVMLEINQRYAMVAFAITAIIYFYLKKRDIQTNWGDAKAGYIFQSTRNNLLYLETAKFHPKNWRPILAAISPDPLRERRLVQMGSWLEARRGLYTVAEIHASGDPDVHERLAYRKRRRDELARHFKSLDMVAFGEVVVVDDYNDGFITFLQSYAMSGLRPNTLLTCIPDALDVEGRQRFQRTAAILRAFDYNTLLLKPGELALDKTQRVIDLWWRGSRNGSLMALLAYLMKQDRAWRTAKIRIFRAVPEASAETEARQHLDKLLANARIEAEVHVFATAEPPSRFIPEHSAGTADLVMLGLSSGDLEDFPGYLGNMDPLLAQLPTTLLVWSNGDADLFA
ncbi:MAG: amino acid permease [Myxococcota bacterium]